MAAIREAVGGGEIMVDFRPLRLGLGGAAI
jgi:hypothetical protein